MDLNSISSRIKASKTSSTLVSSEISVAFPGFVRNVSIRWTNEVAVSFKVPGHWVGGVTYLGKYPTLPQAVQAIEEYLGVPVSEWKDTSESGQYPETPRAVYSGRSDVLLAEAIEANGIQLPSGDYKLITTEWLFFKEFIASHKGRFDAAMSAPDPYFSLQCYARELSASGRPRQEIMGLFSAAHSLWLRDGNPEDTIADVMDGIANSFGKANQNSLNLPETSMHARVLSIKLQLGNGGMIDSQLLAWTNSPDGPDSVKLSLAFPGRKIESTSEGFFSAMVQVREKLEASNIQAICYASSLNVHPLETSTGVDKGELAFKLTLKKKPEPGDQVSIFDSGPDVLPSSIPAQNRFFETWKKSMNEDHS